MLRTLTFLIALSLPTLVSAQAAIQCDGRQGQARNIPEPWEAHIRTYANGNIRVALLDTIEPAAGAFYLLVLTPPFDVLGGRTCAIVADGDGGIGFAGLDFEAMVASYDPSVGLVLETPAVVFNPYSANFDAQILRVTINQATGTVLPELR